MIKHWQKLAAFLLLAISVPLYAAESRLPGAVAAFELVDSGGRTVTHLDFRGRYLLLAFGFTNCVHVCPMMAANMAAALKIAAQDATGIFISVDSERDTPEIVNRYAASFGENMIGLGGSYQQVNVAANSFKVTYVVSKSQKNYTVQHTSSIFVVDTEGQIVETFPLNARPAEIAAALDGGN